MLLLLFIRKRASPGAQKARGASPHSNTTAVIVAVAAEQVDGGSLPSARLSVQTKCRYSYGKYFDYATRVA